MPFANDIGASWAWVAPAINAFAFALIVLIGRRLPKFAAPISISSILLGFILFWYLLLDVINKGSQNFSIEWFHVNDTLVSWGTVVDPLSVTMLGLVTFVAFNVQVYSVLYMKGQTRTYWYFAVHALFTAVMMAMVLSNNLIFLYITWELVGLCSFLLIGFWYERRSAAEAAKKAFITTRIGDIGLLIGIILLFNATGTFDIPRILQIAQEGSISQATLNAAAVLIFLGAMGKSAQFPFHVWLPDAMEGPTPVSALIHAATMVAAGVFLVARLFPLFLLTPSVLVIIATVGIVTALVAATMALVTTDLKRLLAYSTVSHLGLMMLALGAGGYTAALFHLVTHGLSKALLFLGAGNVLHSTHKTDIREMGGLWRHMPITASAFGIGALALAGVPPLSGFFSKDEVLMAVFEGRAPFFTVLLLITVLLSALYMGRVLITVFFGRSKIQDREIHEPPWLMTLPITLLALFVITTGFISLHWTNTYHGLGTFLFSNAPHIFKMHIGLTVGSVVLALIGIGIAVAIYQFNYISQQMAAFRASRIHRIINNGYYIDQAFQWTINRIVLTFSNVLANFDRIVINDTGVNGTGQSIRLSSMRLKIMQTGRVYNYAMGMVLGVLGLVLIWWIVLA